MPDLQHGAPFSVECWVQATTQPPDYSVPLASFGHYNDPAPFGNASGWNIYQTPGPNSSWIFNLKTVGFFNWSGAVELLKWYHLVISDDLNVIRFFVNGVQRASTSRNNFVPNGLNGDACCAVAKSFPKMEDFFLRRQASPFQPPHIRKNSFSSMIFTPSFCALSSLEPASSPAST